MSTNKSTESAKTCTFFNTPSGCKNGSACTFSHYVSTGIPKGKLNGSLEATSCRWGDSCTKKGCTNAHPSSSLELRRLLSNSESQRNSDYCNSAAELEAFADTVEKKLKKWRECNAAVTSQLTAVTSQLTAVTSQLTAVIPQLVAVTPQLATIIAQLAAVTPQLAALADEMDIDAFGPFPN